MTLTGLLEDSFVDGRAVKLILQTFDSFLCNAQLSNFMLQKVGVVFYRPWTALYNTAKSISRISRKV